MKNKLIALSMGLSIIMCFTTSNSVFAIIGAEDSETVSESGEVKKARVEQPVSTKKTVSVEKQKEDAEIGKALEKGRGNKFLALMKKFGDQAKKYAVMAWNSIKGIVVSLKNMLVGAVKSIYGFRYSSRFLEFPVKLNLGTKKYDLTVEFDFGEPAEKFTEGFKNIEANFLMREKIKILLVPNWYSLPVRAIGSVELIQNYLSVWAGILQFFPPASKLVGEASKSLNHVKEVFVIRPSMAYTYRLYSILNSVLRPAELQAAGGLPYLLFFSTMRLWNSVDYAATMMAHKGLAEEYWQKNKIVLYGNLDYPFDSIFKAKLLAPVDALLKQIRIPIYSSVPKIWESRLARKRAKINNLTVLEKLCDTTHRIPEYTKRVFYFDKMVVPVLDKVKLDEEDKILFVQLMGSLVVDRFVGIPEYLKICSKGSDGKMSFKEAGVMQNVSKKQVAICMAVLERRMPDLVNALKSAVAKMGNNVAGSVFSADLVKRANEILAQVSEEQNKFMEFGKGFDTTANISANELEKFGSNDNERLFMTEDWAKKNNVISLVTHPIFMIQEAVKPFVSQAKQEKAPEAVKEETEELSVEEGSEA